MDRVVVDAPCTGTGTWRRRPDTKWKLSPELLAQRLADQSAVLNQAIGFLKPGGQLVYITCSILPQENDDQVRALLATNANLAVIPASEAWQAAFGSTIPAGIATELGGVVLTPRRTGTDGFYCIVLRRTA